MKALHAAGWLAHHQRDLAEARALLEESLAIARELGDRGGVAWALHCLGRVAYFENEPAAARSLGEQSLTRRAGSRRPVADRVGASLARTGGVHRR